MISKAWVTDLQARYQIRTDGSDGLDGKLRTQVGTPPSFAPSSTSTTSNTNTYPINPSLTHLSERVSTLSEVLGDEQVMKRKGKKMTRQRRQPKLMLKDDDKSQFQRKREDKCHSKQEDSFVAIQEAIKDRPDIPY
jgi:hypothetical protein